MKIYPKPTRKKEVGNLDWSDGEMKRFLCYCPNCQKKILYTRDELSSIVRHLINKKVLNIQGINEGIFKKILSLRFKKVRIIDERNPENLTAKTLLNLHR